VDEAVEPCLRLLQDEDPGVRASACGFFAQKPVDRAVEPCLKLLEDEDRRVRASACGAVARLARFLSPPQRSTAVQSISRLRQDSNEFVRDSADLLSRALLTISARKKH
jgi:HEAT repeat protein